MEPRSSFLRTYTRTSVPTVESQGLVLYLKGENIDRNVLSKSRGHHALPRVYWPGFRSLTSESQAAIAQMKGDDKTSVSESLHLRALPRPIQPMYQNHEAEASCT